MINQPGCATGRHKFVKDEAARGALVQCRVQAYQTPTEVCVAVFAKGARKDSSSITIRESSIEMDIVVDNDNHFVRTWALPHRVDAVQSTYVFMSSKVEFVLRKADGDTWNLAMFK